jgi:hypothetical protein
LLLLLSIRNCVVGIDATVWVIVVRSGDVGVVVVDDDDEEEDDDDDDERIKLKLSFSCCCFGDVS